MITEKTGMPVQFDRQPDHPIGQRSRNQHNTRSVSTVLSAFAPC